MDGVKKGHLVRDETYDEAKAVKVDAIVNTIGFPLVGGPAGSMEVGRNVEIAGKVIHLIIIGHQGAVFVFDAVDANM